jgi:hypothetical protein
MGGLMTEPSRDETDPGGNMSYECDNDDHAIGCQCPGIPAPTVLPRAVINALSYEGGDLLIQKANSDNLDWTWRVRCTDGNTGKSETQVGANLQAVLNKVGSVVQFAHQRRSLT